MKKIGQHATEFFHNISIWEVSGEKGGFTAPPPLFVKCSNEDFAKGGGTKPTFLADNKPKFFCWKNSVACCPMFFMVLYSTLTFSTRLCAIGDPPSTAGSNILTSKTAKKWPNLPNSCRPLSDPPLLWKSSFFRFLKNPFPADFIFLPGKITKIFL